MQWFYGAYLSGLVERCPEIVVGVDKWGRIVYYNDGAEKVLHYTAEEVMSRKVSELLYPSVEEARRVMQAMLESPDSGRVSNLETTLRTKEGEHVRVAFSGSLLRDNDGNIIGSIGFARDIREMRRREQLATVCEIAVSVAHEVNNPLEAIVNNLELMRRALERPQEPEVLEEQRRHIEAIGAAVERIQAIVRRLDEMARQGTYETRRYLQDQLMADLRPEGQDRAGNEGLRAADDAQRWPLAGMKVLVLDDDCAVVESLVELLRTERCIVYSATRPSEALRLVDQTPDLDVVLSDVVMEEMDGYQLYLNLKAKRPELPVILMTAYYYDKDHIIKRSRMEGLEDAIFKKPINPVRLRHVMLTARQKRAASLAMNRQAEALRGG